MGEGAARDDEAEEEEAKGTSNELDMPPLAPFARRLDCGVGVIGMAEIGVGVASGGSTGADGKAGRLGLAGNAMEGI